MLFPRLVLPFSLLICSTSTASSAPRQVADQKAALKTLNSSLSDKFRVPMGRLLESGVVYNEIILRGADAGVTRLWIYRPAAAQVGKETYPVVFVAPAGTPLFYGARQGSGGLPEHLPYVRAGMIVVAYEIDGAVPDNPNEEEMAAGARLFRRAKGGVKNARAALDWTLLHVPRVDSKRLYAVGHSSAGTLALQFAQNEPRLAACAAYAPVADLETRITPESQMFLETQMPGYIDFIRASSPLNNAAKLKCPTLLFHADDDANVPIAEVYAFGQEVYRTNKKLRFCRVATGGHSAPMLQSGIPTAISWLQKLPPKAAPIAKKGR